MKSRRNLWSAFPKEVQEWFRAGAPSVCGNDEIDELLAQLAPWIRSDEIVVTRESQSFFDLMEKRYPVGFNRIDWSRVPAHFYADVLEMKSGQDVDSKTQVEKLLQIRTTVEELVSRGLGSDAREVFWFGDDYELSLRMSLRTFLECYVILFTTPQHNYVVPKNCDWCLNYSMEGQLSFGFAVSS